MVYEKIEENSAQKGKPVNMEVKDYFTERKQVNMEVIKQQLPKNAQNKLAYMTNQLDIYYNDGIPTKLLPYIALLLFDLKQLKKVFPIYHKVVDITPNSVKEGYTHAALDDSKQGYILTIAYQNILEQTYGGLSGKSATNLKHWLVDQRNISVDKFSFKKYDVGAIVTYLNLIENKVNPFSISNLRYALGLFNGDKNISS